MARELSVMVIPAFRYISLLVRISPEASGQSGLVRFPFFFLLGNYTSYLKPRNLSASAPRK